MKTKYDIFLSEIKWNSLTYFYDFELFYNSRINNKFFSIVLPPPNITGFLHIGHSFQCAILDYLIRYKKLRGYCVYWQGGIDHAGIATQMVVERNLLSVNLSKSLFTRIFFIKLCWQWRFYSFRIIVAQLKLLSTYIDWSFCRFTLDSSYILSVNIAFIRLYNGGFIFRKVSLVNWDVVLNTVISDLEIIAVEDDQKLLFLRYTSIGFLFFLDIATTKPNSVIWDVAVAVNPDDFRYNKVFGKYVRIPFINKAIPVIIDKFVQLFFGSGCVKITPAYDFDDYKIATHNFLKEKSIFNFKNELLIFINNCYKNITSRNLVNSIIFFFYFYRVILQIIQYRGLVKKGDRSDAVVKPLLLKQWFVAVKTLALRSINVVKNGKLIFFPFLYKHVFFYWMFGITDWCISRQIWWGHRIPAWYTSVDKVFVGFSKNDICFRYSFNKKLHYLIRDCDVLDTWFSSALWSFSCFGWPENTMKYCLFYPLNVLVTGYDILFFWISRMVMFGLYLTGVVPFQNVYIHGLITDEKGIKMSKSRGNTIDPIDVIVGITFNELVQKKMFGITSTSDRKKVFNYFSNKYPCGILAFGTDSLRLALCSAATPGKNIFFSIKRVEIFRNFCTKIWSIARFIYLSAMNCGFFFESFKYKLVNIYKNFNFLSDIDRFLLFSWQNTKDSIRNNVNEYRFDLVLCALYKFIIYILSNIYINVFRKYSIIYNIYDDKFLLSFYVFFFIFFEVLKELQLIAPNVSSEIWFYLSFFLGRINFSKLINCSFTLPKYFFNFNNFDCNFLLCFISDLKNILNKYIRKSELFFLVVCSDKLSKFTRDILWYNQSIICSLVNISDILFTNIKFYNKNFIFVKGVKCFILTETVISSGIIDNKIIQKKDLFTYLVMQLYNLKKLNSGYFYKSICIKYEFIRCCCIFIQEIFNKLK